MATLEDRLLGEKTHYYCSSSEDERETEEENNEKNIRNPLGTSVASEMDDREGSSTNTGPKGVIKDWQRYKQLEAEQRREQERERIILAKKLAISCRSHLDDEKSKEEKNEENVEDLIDEGILRQYILKRMEEMMENTSQKKMFGQVLTVNSGEEFLEAVDKEEKEVTVIVHLYEPSGPGCNAMSGSLISLASDYPYIKFCCLQASNVGVSRRFQGTGVPALLVYKGGQMVGNFVRLTDDLGEDFFATDVESFLIEHGIIMDKSLVPPGVKTVKGPAIEQDDSDSD